MNGYERYSQIELSELPTNGIFDGVPKPPLFDHLGVITQRGLRFSGLLDNIVAPLHDAPFIRNCPCPVAQRPIA